MMASAFLVILLSYFAFSRTNARAPWTACGERSGDSFGTKVAPAGDVNGDGFADVAVWASGFEKNTGKIYVYLGSRKGLSRAPAWVKQGESLGDEYGHSFGTVGDVNKDGYGDLIVAAQGYSLPKAPGIGKAYLYSGSSKGLSEMPVWSQTGNAPNENFGDCSGWAGDANRDGMADALVGAYGHDHYRGAAYLFEGSRTGFLSPKPVWQGKGERPGDWYGYSVASAGDVNHDGYPDILIGAKMVPKGPLSHVGKVYAYYGSKNGLSPKPSWTATGEKAQGLFGWRALSAHDVNGDGYDDVVIAAYSFSAPSASSCGKVYVYLGSPKGLLPDPAWTQTGRMAGAFFGHSIASGDLNRDGFSDILVGSPNDRPNGKVYLYLGGPQGPSTTPSCVIEGEDSDSGFGDYLCNAGDVNGDGYPDVLVGAPDHKEKGARSGKVYLYYGGKDGKLGLLPR